MESWLVRTWWGFWPSEHLSIRIETANRPIVTPLPFILSLSHTLPFSVQLSRASRSHPLPLSHSKSTTAWMTNHITISHRGVARPFLPLLFVYVRRTNGRTRIRTLRSAANNPRWTAFSRLRIPSQCSALQATSIWLYLQPTLQKSPKIFAFVRWGCTRCDVPFCQLCSRRMMRLVAFKGKTSPKNLLEDVKKGRASVQPVWASDVGMNGRTNRGLMSIC